MTTPHQLYAEIVYGALDTTSDRVEEIRDHPTSNYKPVCISGLLRRGMG
jgi:hypothetical protein